MNEESLFAAALDVAGPERAAYLDRACAADPDLRNRVERLLAAEHGPGILDRPKAPPLSGMFRIDAPLAAGQVFAGRFTLREKLGEGGMGEVWVADQTEPVRRRVALKVIRPGHGSAHRLARFEQERQTLALMNHPNIARVFDAGVADGGRPFFVMELIDGTPLTTYCDAARLPLHDRLDLFVQVCQAVQHAHQKGVIHRDLKPSNILVAEVDGRPLPKVIDFGIAKATGDDVANHAVSTEIGMLVGTLEYMSPEQCELNNPDVDTRCDVHALGVVLYELLTGTVPVAREHLRAAPFDEMLRIIKEVEPPRPSQRLAEVRSARRGLRNEGPPTPHSALRIPRLQELDWIVMKCLDKDRGRRYETANGLAMDVQRYLADEPVLAAAPSTAYRLRKFARRHRTGLVVSAGFLTGLVVAVVALSVALVAVDRERQEKEAALETEAKRRQLARAALKTMMSEVVERHLARQPELGAEQRTFLEQVLLYCEQFAADSSRDEASRADVAEAYGWVGFVRSRLGQRPEAETAFARSRDLYAALAAEFPDTPAYKVGIGRANFHLAQQERIAGRNAGARLILEENLPQLRELAATSDPMAREELVTALIELGIVLKNLNQVKPAVAAYREAIDIGTRLADEFPADPDHRGLLGRAYGGLGVVLERTDRTEAKAAYSRAVEILEKAVVESPGDLGNAGYLAIQTDHLASILRDEKSDEEAERRFEQALALRRQQVAAFPNVPEFQSGLAVTLNNLGILYKNTSRLEKAEKVYTEAAAIHQQMAKRYPDEPDYQNYSAGALGNIARLHLDRRDFDGARRLYERAMPYHRAALSKEPNHPAYRNFYRITCWRTSEALLGLNDHAGAAAAAGQFLEVNFEPPRDAYTAACLLSGCVRLATADCLPDLVRGVLTTWYGNQAVEALRIAVVLKAKEVALIDRERAFGPLRERPDFRALRLGLRAK